MEEEKLPLTAHFEELRKRIIICLIAIGIGFSLSYFFVEHIFSFISRPLTVVLPRESSFIFTGITEAFFTYFKLSLFSGIFLASPIILYQLWKFVAPGLYENEKKYLLPFIFFSTFFFIAGIAFCYFIVLPAAFKFFVSYNTSTIRMLPSLGEYLSFTCIFLLAFGVVFEVPIFIICLSKLGIIKERHLASNRKLVIIGSFIIAAILTPTPDAINQSLMALPLIVLYELSIFVVRFIEKGKLAKKASL